MVLLHTDLENVSANHVVTLKIERASFSKTPVTTDQSTPHHITEDRNFQTWYTIQYKIFLPADEQGTKWHI